MPQIHSIGNTPPPAQRRNAALPGARRAKKSLLAPRDVDAPRGLYTPPRPSRVILTHESVNLVA